MTPDKLQVFKIVNVLLVCHFVKKKKKMAGNQSMFLKRSPDKTDFNVFKKTLRLIIKQLYSG